MRRKREGIDGFLACRGSGRWGPIPSHEEDLMTRRPWIHFALVTGSLAFATIVAGCNGDTNPLVVGDGGETPGTNPDGGAANKKDTGTGSLNRADGGNNNPFRFEVLPDAPPPPPPNMDSVLIVPGRARLVGT